MTTPQRTGPYETGEQSSPFLKWLIPLLVAIALLIGALFLFGVFDADVAVDPGSVDVEAPEVDADVDADVPDVDVEAPDVDVDPGSIDVEDPDADAEAETDQ